MADIFVSYSRVDAALVQQLTVALEENGWSVWWDRSIPPGSSFDEVIEAELNAARCVIVLWSRTSISSSWVKEEAEEGLQRGVLTPVMIDDTRPPLGFRRVQALNLNNWDGDRAHHGYQQLLSAVRTLLGDAPPAGSNATSTAVPIASAAAGELPMADSATDGVAAIATVPSADATGTSEPEEAGERPSSSRAFWLVPLATVAVVAVVYLALNAVLSQRADRLLGLIDSLSRQQPIEYVAAKTLLPAPSPGNDGHFVNALADEMASGKVSMQFDETQAVIMLGSDGLFQSGSGTIDALGRSVVVRVGQVLSDWPHRPIEVVAHTDNVPIRTPRYPSNQALSDARAEEVAEILREQLGPGVDVRSTGMGDVQPLNDNATRENRARNRRVEIRVPLK